jgi:hypothetical protein
MCTLYSSDNLKVPRARLGAWCVQLIRELMEEGLAKSDAIEGGDTFWAEKPASPARTMARA